MSKKPTTPGMEPRPFGAGACSSRPGSGIPVAFGSSTPRSALPISTARKLTKDKMGSAIHSSLEDIHYSKNYSERRGMLPKGAGAGDYGSGGSLTPVSSRTPREKLPAASKDLQGQFSALVPLGGSVSDDNAALDQWKEDKKKAAEYERLDEIRKKLSQQLAARKIQQCFLFGLWRKEREEMEKVLQERAQLTDLVKNLKDQIRVSKDLHATESARVLELENEVQGMKKQTSTSENSLKISEGERKELTEQKAFLEKEVTSLKEENRSLALELEKCRSELVKKAEENEGQVKKLMDLENDKEELEIENIEIQKVLNTSKLKYLQRRRSMLMAFGQFSIFGILRFLLGSRGAVGTNVNELD